MVAVVSGNGLGLLNGFVPGVGAAAGRGTVGQGSQYLNAGNGHLVLQGSDGGLTFDGLALSDIRTYNSTGGGAGGAWSWGFSRSIVNLTGTANQAGSTVQRRADDGSLVTYAYDAASGLYTATDEAGTVDTLAWNATSNTWTWTGGTSGLKETYDNHGLLTKIADPRTNAVYTLDYLNGQLNQVRAADGDALVFGYDGQGRLTSLSSVSIAQNGMPAVNRQTVTYGYDDLGRLSSVATSLVGDDGAPAGTFTTTYTYDGDSLRMASMTQSDGLSVSYSYTQVNGQYVLSRVASAMNGVVQDVQTMAYASVTEGGQTYLITTVSDAAGNGWAYKTDAQGRIHSVTSPAVDGHREVTTYTYDAHGNVLTAYDVTGRGMTYTYDVHGNRVTEQDAAGNILTRTFDAANRVLTETTYLDPTPGGMPVAGAAHDTVRYVYDTVGRLDFIIDAAGGVTQYNYATSGLVSEAWKEVGSTYDVTSLAADAALAFTTMQTWSKAQDWSRSERTNFVYDARGLLITRSDYAVSNSVTGVVTTQFIYDARGLLVQQFIKRTAGTETTSYAYDGIGRLVSSVTSTGERTTWVYGNDGHVIVTTTDPATGQSTITNQAFDARGNLVSTVFSAGDSSLSRTTRYVYDASGHLVATVQPDGAASFAFYDEAGQLIGEVDATGAMTRYERDDAGRLLSQIRCANLVDTRDWLEGDTVQVTASSIQFDTTPADTITHYAYDAAGRVATTTNAAGTTTAYTYDGESHLVRQVVGDGDDARTERYFHDAAGRLTGTLDAEGYLVETTYTQAGRVASMIAYATRTPADQWYAGPLAQLRPATAAGDRVTTYKYDAQGRLAGVIDPESFVTVYKYDPTANTVSTYRVMARHGDWRTWTAIQLQSNLGSTPVDTLDRYDGEGRLVSRTTQDGVNTTYAYDGEGRLLTVTEKEGTNTVTRDTRVYDGVGELIRSTDSLGRVTLYTYDAAGREASRTDPLGNTTWTSYDADGRVRFTARGMAGADGTLNALVSLSEVAYDAWGRVVRTTTYAAAAPFDPLVSPDTASLAALATTVADDLSDATIVRAYDAEGRLVTLTDEAGNTTTYGYDAFDDVASIQAPSRDGITPTTLFTYDHRGHAVGTREEAGSDVRSTASTIDAFGQVISATSAGGTVTAYEYDHRGQQTARVDRPGSGNLRTTTTYDAIGRVLTQVDANGAVVTYTFNDATRTITTRSGAGVVTTTRQDHAGHAISVADASGHVTRYTYDSEGQLVSTTDADGGVATIVRDADGRAVLTTDAAGRQVAYTYDASGHVLTEVVDPEGAALTTTWTYDARGRQLSVTDPVGIVSRYTYGATDDALSIVHDANGSAVTERFTYDVDGQVLTATVYSSGGALQVTRYRYDGWGRLVERTDDANVQPQVTTFVYDLDNHVIATMRADGTATYAAYDDLGRLIYSLDSAGPAGAGMGALTRYWYDAVGNQTAARYYSTLVSMAGVADDIANRRGRDASNTTFAALDALAAAGAYEESFTAYDGDNRAVYGVARDQTLTRWFYNADGRLESIVLNAQPVQYPQYYPGYLESIRSGGPNAVSQAWAMTVNCYSGTWQHQVIYLFDAAGRAIYQVDNGTIAGTASWVVRKNTYDGSGVLTATTQYTTAVASTAIVRGTTTVANLDSLMASASANARTTHYVYDAAGREIAQIDPDGEVSYTLRDADGRVTDAISRDGAAVHVEYDANGRIVRTLTAEARVDTSGWLDADGKPTAALANYAFAASPNDDQQHNVYDDLGRLVSTTHSYLDGAVTRGSETRFTYDGDGRLLSQTERDLAGGAENRLTRFFYDANGRRIGVLAADGSLQTTRYDAAGQVVDTTAYATFTDPAHRATGQLADLQPPASLNDAVTVDFHDAYGRLVGQVDADGYLTTNTYNGAGLLLTRQRYDKPVGEGSRGSLADALANVKAAVAATHTEKWTYTPDGTVLTYVDANGLLTSYNVDTLGHVLSVIASGQATYYRYDATGHVIAVSKRTGTYSSDITAAGSSTYDLMGRLASSTDGLGNTTWYLYDRAGRRQYTVVGETGDGGVPNKSGDVTSWTYDSQGRPLQETRYSARIDLSSMASVSVATVESALASAPAGDADGTTRYTYDQAGNLSSRDAGGHVTTYAYNGFGELVSQNEAGGYERVTTFVRDGAGRIIRTVTSAASPGGTEIIADDRWTFDAYGRVISHLDLAGGLDTYTYDPLGEQVGHVRAFTGGDRSESTTYDAYGRALTTTDVLGLVTTYQYDDAHRRMTMTAPGGLVTVTDHDEYGHVTRVQGPDTKVTTYLYDYLGNLKEIDNPDSTKELHAWDIESHEKSFTDASGRLTTYTYDAMGRVLTMVQDPAGLALTTTTRYSGRGLALTVTDPLGIVTIYTHAADGNIVRMQVNPLAGMSAAQDVTYAYDGDGHVIDEVHEDGAEAVRRYDASGHLVFEQGLIGPAQAYRYDAAGNLVQKTSGGFSSYYFYDEAGEVLWEVDETGTSSLATDGSVVQSIDGARVIQTMRDNYGVVVGTTRYATLLSATDVMRLRGAATDASAPRVSALSAMVVTSPEDRSDHRFVDATGRLAFTIDAEGGVVEYRYDTAGRLLDQFTYVTAIDMHGDFGAKMKAASATLQDVRDAVAAAGNTEQNSRRERHYYDSRGRLRFLLQINGATQRGFIPTYEYTYDGAGRQLGEGLLSTGVDMAHALNQAALEESTSEVSSTAYLYDHIYDAAGREVYSGTPMGAITRYDRDADGNIVAKTVFNNRISPWLDQTPAMTKQYVEAANPNPADRYTVYYTYDASGRVVTSHDDLHPEAVSYYTYDSRGNKTSYTDGFGSTWRYTYDEKGRLTVETSPAISQSWFDGNGQFHTATGPVITRYTYGDDGQVLSESVLGLDGAATTTSYVRDADGQIVESRQAAGGSYDLAQGRLIDASQAAVTRITRNAFGEAVVVQDPVGNYSYTAYDAMGRVAFEVDVLGDVVGYAYDAQGNTTTVTRFANTLNLSAAPAGWHAGAPLGSDEIAAALAPGADDRSINTTYDPFGRKLSVMLPPVAFVTADGVSGVDRPITTYAYDTAGRLMSESVYRMPKDSQHGVPVWETITHAYDNDGFEITTGGGVGGTIQRIFNARGLVLTETSGPGWNYQNSQDNRTSTYTYDAAGNRLTETVSRTVANVDGTQTGGTLKTTYGYDAAGRVTSVTRNGSTITTVYDAMGRIAEVDSPPFKALVDDWKERIAADPSLTLASDSLYKVVYDIARYSYDAEGRRVVEAHTASDGTLGSDTYTMYDQAGNAVATWTQEQGAPADPTRSTATYNAYDVAGRLVSSARWQVGMDGSRGLVVTHERYDDMGRQTETWTVDAGGTTESQLITDYNAFGEVIRTSNALGVITAMTYDAAGRVITRIDGDTGVLHRLAYDLAGDVETDTTTITGGGGDLVTHLRRDALGQLLAQWSTLNGVTQPGSTSYQYDVWGKVTFSSDANADYVRYAYDEFGNLIKQSQRQNSVVDVHGKGVGPDTLMTKAYDAAGNLVRDTDGNANSTVYTYDAAGQLVKMVDGAGDVTLYAYDALGNRVATEVDASADAHEISFVDVDVKGHIVREGDFGADAQGARGAIWRQVYLLDQSGNRLVSYDGTGAAFLQAGDTANAALHANYYVYDCQDRVIYSQDGVQHAATIDHRGALYFSGMPTGAFGMQPFNPDFENGDSGWDKTAGWSIIKGTKPSNGEWEGVYDGSGPQTLVNQNRAPVIPGQSITAKASIALYKPSGTHPAGALLLMWFDAQGNLLRADKSEEINQGDQGEYTVVSVTGTAPDGAAYATIGLSGSTDGSGGSAVFDAVQWNYQYLVPIPDDHTEYGNRSVYDLNGHLVSQTDADGNTQTWERDVYGRALKHTDLSGAKYEYTYDQYSGLLTRETDNWQDQMTGASAPAFVGVRPVSSSWTTYQYTANGSIARIDRSDGSWSTYGYNSRNLLSSEDNSVMDGGGKTITQHQTMGYDQQNRLNTITIYNDNHTAIQWEYIAYDGNGNRRHISTTGTNGGTDAWYTYDGANRVTVSAGSLVNGTIVVSAASTSFGLTYDGAGNIAARITGTGTNQRVQQNFYDLRNQLVRANYAVTVGKDENNGVAETRTYDANGNVIEDVQYYASNAVSSVRYNPKTDPDNPQYLDGASPPDGKPIGGLIYNATINRYDAFGRLVAQQTYGHDQYWDGTGGENAPDPLPADGAPNWSGMTLKSSVLYQGPNGVSGYDAMGNAVFYQYKTGTTRTDQYTVSYLKKDTYLEAATIGQNTSNNSDVRTATDESYYNAFGERIAIVQHTQYAYGTVKDQVRLFAFDGRGQIISRRDGTANGNTIDQGTSANTQTQHYYYVGGQQYIHTNNDKLFDVTSQVTAFSSGDGSSDYLVQEGDTLRTIAQAVYGNASMWYVIAQANALNGDNDLTVGLTLTIPSITTTKNDSTTFKPYNPSEIQGSTTPELPVIATPPPPPKHHCNVLASIIVIAVTVIVTIYAGPIAGQAVGSSLAGAMIGAAAGSLAGQVAGNALGTQSGISFGQILTAAATAGVTQGIGNYAATGNAFTNAEEATAAATAAGNTATISNVEFWGHVAQGAGGYVTQEAVGKALNQQEHFSWAGLVSTSLASGVGYEVGPSVTDASAGAPSAPAWQTAAAALTTDVVKRESMVALGDRKYASSWDQVGENAAGTYIGTAGSNYINSAGSASTVRGRAVATENDVLGEYNARGAAIVLNQTLSEQMALAGAPLLAAGDWTSALAGTYGTSGGRGSGGFGGPVMPPDSQAWNSGTDGSVLDTDYRSGAASEYAGLADRPKTYTLLPPVVVTANAPGVVRSDYDPTWAARVMDGQRTMYARGLDAEADYRRSALETATVNAHRGDLDEYIALRRAKGEEMVRNSGHLIMTAAYQAVKAEGKKVANWFVRAVSVGGTVQAANYAQMGAFASGDRHFEEVGDRIRAQAADQMVHPVKDVFEMTEVDDIFATGFEAATVVESLPSATVQVLTKGPILLERTAAVAGDLRGYLTKARSVAQSGERGVGAAAEVEAAVSERSAVNVPGTIADAGSTDRAGELAGDTAADLSAPMQPNETSTPTGGVGSSSRRTAPPPPPPPKRFATEAAFNRAANAAEPNQVYEFNGYTWKTDDLGRVESVEGQIRLNGIDGRAGTDGVSTTVIGKSVDAQQGDVGFHLLGDQFGGPTNRLNVVPGNGMPIDGLTNLNQGAYASWERSIRSLASDPKRLVDVRIEPGYYEGNVTTRPDVFYASHRVDGGTWVTTLFRNRPGG